MYYFRGSILPVLSTIVLSLATACTQDYSLSNQEMPPSTPNQTETPIPSATPNPLELAMTATAAVAQASNPAEHNTDWTPYFQLFNGVEMALVPAGCFDMGSENFGTDERPVNRQCFNESFWIDRTEVTNAQYGSEGHFKGDNRPRDSVTWVEARDFCYSRGARLPTEREWEYAARGPDSFVFPWGNDYVPNNAVIKGNSDNQSADVGTRLGDVSWVGALDFSGNLREWVNTLSHEFRFPYPYNSSDGREDSTITNRLRVIRGGVYYFDSAMHTSERGNYAATIDSTAIGFRCARS